MKYRIYTIDNTLLKEGVEVETLRLKDGTEIPAVLVGERGRGRELGVLPVNAEPGEVLRCAEIGQTRSGRPRLRKTDCEGAEGILLVFRPEYGFRGSVDMPDFGERVVARGYVAQGDAGRMGGNAQYVLRFDRPTDIGFSFTRGGRLYGEPAEWRLWWDGEKLHLLPAEEAELLE